MNVYEICQEMERRMAKMGVHTTAHYEAGTELIAEAIRQAVLAEREACAKLADSYDGKCPECGGEECGWYGNEPGGRIAAAIRARTDA